MGPSRPLRIGDDPSAVSGFGRARDVPVHSTAAGPQNAHEAPPLLLGKGKKKITASPWCPNMVPSSLPFGMP